MQLRRDSRTFWIYNELKPEFQHYYEEMTDSWVRTQINVKFFLRSTKLVGKNFKSSVVIK